MSKKSSKSTKKSSKEKKNVRKLRDISEIDITKHYLVPKHELLSEEEKQELLKKYNIRLSDLPRIKISDPAIKNLGAKPGDIVKIIRNSPTAGESVYYRVVVED
ncbi:DNA-directed RNA polymerase subunit H (EC 2.7.7.6) [Nanoarchaeota archaeon]